MNLVPPAFPVGPQLDPGEIADWVEFVALAKRSSFKRGDLKSAVQQEELAAPDQAEEEAWEALKVRSNLFGARWPLRLIGNRLTRKSPSPVPLPFYRFLCFLGFGSVDPIDRTLFELAVAAVLPCLTGQAALHMGAPASEGMDPSFRERVKRYAEESGLLPTELKSEPLSHDQDLGVDAVTWFPFGDGRGVHLHFLVQCATGGDWGDKLHDIDLAVWKDHIYWGVDPVRVFAVPFVLVLPEAKWVRTARSAGLILDRPRLVELALRSPLPAPLISEFTRRVRFLAAS